MTNNEEFNHSTRMTSVGQEMEKVKDDIVAIFKNVIEGAFPIISDDGKYKLEILKTTFESKSRAFISTLKLTEEGSSEDKIEDVTICELDELLFNKAILLSEVGNEGSLIDPYFLEVQRQRMHFGIKKMLNEKKAI
jgi:hypothetical protein